MKFVDERYQRSSSDLLYRVPIAGKNSFIYFKEPLHAFIPNLTYRLIELAKIPYEEIQGTPTGILSLRILRSCLVKNCLLLSPCLLGWHVVTRICARYRDIDGHLDMVMAIYRKHGDRAPWLQRLFLTRQVLRAASLKELMNERVWDEEMFERIPEEMIAAILAYIQNSLSKVDDQSFQSKIKTLKSNRLRKIAMTLTEKYIEDGVLFGAIRTYQELLGKAV